VAFDCLRVAEKIDVNDPFDFLPFCNENSSMIRGVHTMFYSSEPQAFREFLRDKLGFPWNDVGNGWLIFDLPEADMGCHPATPGGDPPSGSHAISFYCDDVHKTVAELRARGVEFDDAIADRGYGLVTHFTMPGNVQVQLYQPVYEKKGLKGGKKETKRGSTG